MAGIDEWQARVERMSPEDGGHYFFGYYDLQAWDGPEKNHLVHRVAFLNRRPGQEDAAEWGPLSPSDPVFEPAGRTEAWSFQQGAMLQWHPYHPGTALYNRRHQGRYESVTRELRNGAERVLTRPIAAVSPCGRVALCINFCRLYDFRPGYGYPGLPDPWADKPQPEDDGICLVDLESGASSLILSLAQIGAFRPDQTAPSLGT